MRKIRSKGMCIIVFLIVLSFSSFVFASHGHNPTTGGPPNVFFAADSYTGPSTRLHWQIWEATSCTFTGPEGFGSINTITSGSHRVNAISVDTTFTITCTNAKGSSTDTVTIRMPTQVSCKGEPNPAIAGETITWTAYPTGGNGQYIYFWSGIFTSNEKVYEHTNTFPNYYRARVQVISPPWGSTNDPYNTHSTTCDVQVNPAPTGPTVSLTSDKQISAIGDPITLSWNTGQSPTSCVASGDWSGAKSVSGGSQVITPTKSSNTYILTCSKSGFPPSSSQVTVSTSANPVISISSNKLVAAAGEQVSIDIDVSNNPTSCTFRGFNYERTGHDLGGDFIPLCTRLGFTYGGSCYRYFTMSQEETVTVSCTNALGSSEESITIRLAECGNYVLDPGEDCDDGNTVDGDSCSSTCVNTHCPYVAVCGNGIADLSDGEECDDGLVDAADTFHSSNPPDSVGDDDGVCVIDKIQGVECRNNLCGDGYLNANGPDGIPGNADDEQCDDGNTLDGDLCSSTCKKECNLISSTISLKTDNNGDGRAGIGDVINVLSVMDSRGDCSSAQHLQVDADAQSSECSLRFANDAKAGWMQGIDIPVSTISEGQSALSYDWTITQVREECFFSRMDAVQTHLRSTIPTNNNDPSLSSVAASGSFEFWGIQCGDGVVEGSEQCDDGDTDPTDTFHTLGTVEQNDDDGVCVMDPSRSYECRTNVCGDGYRDHASEQCDDGDQFSWDGCSDTCQIECEILSLNANLVDDNGNSVADPGEVVQISGTMSDSCPASAHLQIDANNGPSCVLEYSGGHMRGIEGVVTKSGSSFSGSWTVPTIQHECAGQTVTLDQAMLRTDVPGVGTQLSNVVSASGSPLTFPTYMVCMDRCAAGTNCCGNGNVDRSEGEECDDGNLDFGDGCTPYCTIETCGDGVVQSPEECEPSLAPSYCDENCKSII